MAWFNKIFLPKFLKPTDDLVSGGNPSIDDDIIAEIISDEEIEAAGEDEPLLNS